MTRVIAAAANIFFSLILGALALAICAVNFPNMVDDMFVVADAIKRFFTETVGIPVEYNIWVKFFFKEESLVFMLFVIIMRVVLALLAWGVTSLFSSKEQY